MHETGKVTLKIIYLKTYIFGLVRLKVETFCPTTNRHKTNKYENKNSSSPTTTQGRTVRKSKLIIVRTITIQTAARP